MHGPLVRQFPEGVEHPSPHRHPPRTHDLPAIMSRRRSRGGRTTALRLLSAVAACAAADLLWNNGELLLRVRKQGSAVSPSPISRLLSAVADRKLTAHSFEYRRIERAGGDDDGDRTYTYNFVPTLSYTQEGYSPNSERVSVDLLLDGSQPTTPAGRQRWEGSATSDNVPKVQAGQEMAFIISNFPTANLLTPSHCPTGILVWFKSAVDTSVVFAAPAFYYNSTQNVDEDDDDTYKELIVRTTIVDPGQYEVHIVAYQAEVTGAGARGTLGDVRPVPGSPWNLSVINDDGNSATNAVATTGGSPQPTQIQVPERMCDLSDLQTSGNGRWVQCSSAGIPAEQCLEDDWVYLPVDCRYDIFTAPDALEMAKAIVDARGDDKPIWIVLTGSSIERGTLHAMVDFLGGIIDDWENIAEIDGEESGGRTTIADALFFKISDQQGKGSLKKCWGWYDVQIGGIRLSYQDYRNLYVHDRTYREAALHRWTEIVHEGPDMILVGDVNKFNYDTIPYMQMLQAAAESPAFDGQIIFSPQKERLLTSGIGSSYLCASADQLSGKATTSIREKIDTGLLSALQECGETCSNLASRLHISDETTMSWSFVFDMERSLSSEMFAQHFHLYSKRGEPRSQCGTEHNDRRYIIGSVTEMAAQMYLSTILQHLHKKAGSPFNQRFRSCGSVYERAFARRHPFRACFSCPVKACCDFPNVGWNPPETPGQSLSDLELKNKVEKFRDGDGHEFCYAGTDGPFILSDGMKKFDYDRRRLESF